MLKKVIGPLAIYVAFLISFGSADAMSKDAIDAWNAVKGPAASSIFNFAKRKHIECYTLEEGKKSCVLANITYMVEDIYPDYGPSPEYAVAVIHATVDTGNTDYFTSYIFRRNERGSYDFLSTIRGSIGNPISVKLESGALLMLTKTLKQNDAHHNPTGRTIWRVDLATGKARYVSGNK